MVVGQAFLFTVLPPIGREIGLEDYQVGLVMSVHGLFMLFVGPIWGAISETWGRRPVIFLGGLIFCISVVMFGIIVDAALSGTISLFMVIACFVGSRALFALGAGAVTPAAMALAADMSSREMRLKTLSIMTAATSSGAIIGPSVSAFLTIFGLSLPFYFIAFSGILILVGAAFLLPNSRPVSSSNGKGYRELLKGNILRISSGSSLFMIGTYGMFSMLGFFVQDRFSLDPITAAKIMGFGLMCAASATIFIQVFILSWVKLNPKFFIILGILFGFISVNLLWYAPTISIFYLAMLSNGIGQGLAMPAINTSLSLSAGPEYQGRLAGITTSTQAIAFLVAPASSVALYQLTGWGAFLASGIIIFLSFILFIFMPSVQKINKT
jgi:MFS family permease